MGDERMANLPCPCQEVEGVLTEQEVARSWARLFKAERTSETFVKAEVLLEELRPESPLRHRLSIELEELRELSVKA
jgi:hypothetical protein